MQLEVLAFLRTTKIEATQIEILKSRYLKTGLTTSEYVYFRISKVI